MTFTLVVAIGLAGLGALMVAGSIWSDTPGIAAPDGAFTSVSVQSFYGCGIRTDRTLRCWGEVGAPSGAYPQGRKPNVPEGPFVSVSVAVDRGCAVRSDGTVACWGANVDVPAGLPLAAQVVATNDRTCARAATGTTSCWTTANPSSVVTLPGSFRSLARSSWQSALGGICGVLDDGTISCPGAAVNPRLVGRFERVAIEGSLGCALTTEGEMKCWDRGTGGTPSLAPPGGTFNDLLVGHDYACGLRTGGALACSAGPHGTLAQVPEGAFVSLGAGGWSNCAVRDSGSVACWGSDPNPEFGFEGLLKPGVALLLAGVGIGTIAAALLGIGRPAAVRSR